jgi:hypothetical protein
MVSALHFEVCQRVKHWRSEGRNDEWPGASLRYLLSC